jgi:hypothetical protein
MIFASFVFVFFFLLLNFLRNATCISNYTLLDVVVKITISLCQRAYI